MSIFDQRNQRVGYQYNFNGSIRIDSVRGRGELAEELRKLLAEVEAAKKAGALENEAAEDAGHYLNQAIQKSESGASDKKGIMDRIEKAREVIEKAAATTASLTGLVTALGAAGQAIMRVFQ
jgi:hypothetical protein